MVLRKLKLDRKNPGDHPDRREFPPPQWALSFNRFNASNDYTTLLSTYDAFLAVASNDPTIEDDVLSYIRNAEQQLKNGDLAAIFSGVDAQAEAPSSVPEPPTQHVLLFALAMIAVLRARRPLTLARDLWGAVILRAA